MVMRGSLLRRDPRPAPRSARLSVLSVQRTCVHDGPGVRTTVFLRGCPLGCRWCQNPEARAFARPSSPEAGRTVAEILAAVARDRPYYDRTSGGLTLSGGEPLAQDLDALVALLAAAKEDGLDVTVETAGHVPWKAFEAVRPFVDLFLYDLKVVGDPALHRRLAGADGRRIEANLRRLVATGARVRVRMCVVPGMNDGRDRIEAAAGLLRSVGLPSIELVRYHDLHERKARALGLDREALGIDAEGALGALRAAADAFDSLGVRAVVPPAGVVRGAAAFPERVRSLQRDIRAAGYGVCMESAALKTAWWRRHGDAGPLPVRRARMLRHVLGHKRVDVHPRELLVGNFTSRRVGGNVWVEYFGAAMVLTLWNIDRQRPVRFACSLSDKALFYTRLAPFWLTRGLFSRVFDGKGDLGAFALRTIEKRCGFNNNMAGIAHFVVNCERLLRLGTTGLIREAEAGRAARPEAADFFEGVGIALRGLEEFAGRYAARLREMAASESDPGRRGELARMAEACDRVPREPARTFHEALQAILFLEVALCTESFENAISLGRLDQVLGPYYRADLEAGRIDHESARELVACFILKLDEIIFLNDGDTLFQFGKLFESLSPVETVTMGGTDAAGRDCTNEVTYMLLDACELRPIGANMAARIHPGSPARYVERIAEVYLGGSPMPALYNDEPYVAALRREYDTTLEDARGYAIVGCVEPTASDDHFGNTDSANVNLAIPFLQALRGDTRRLWRLGDLGQLDRHLERAVRSGLRRAEAAVPALAPLARAWRGLAGRLPGGAVRPPRTMDDLVARFRERLDEVVRDVLADQQRIEAELSRSLVTPLASALFPGCMDSGKDVHEGGTRHNSSGIQAIGVTDVADSLAAIDDLVFRQRRYTMAEVLDALDDDFEGDRHRTMHADMRSAPKFGDDAAGSAHLWMHRVLEAWVGALRSAPHPSRGGRYVAGYYGLNVNRVYGLHTPALPSGRKAGTPLANSLCPHHGMRMADLTSSLNAVARLDFARFAPNGTTLTPTIDSGMFTGGDGPRNLAGLIRGFFDQGGMQFQPNLVSRDLLLDAFRNPGKHKDLVVRIAGYCAYFDDLSDELKREIIDRSYYTQ